MYDKLGEMLNDALNAGEIPQFDTFKQENLNLNSSRNKNSGSFSFKESQNQAENKIINSKNDSETSENGEKMYKYTDFIHFPYTIRQILTTLHIAYPFSWQKLKKQLLNDIKFSHPDTKKNTIQSSKNMQNFRQIEINKLISFYKELDKFFKEG